MAATEGIKQHQSTWSPYDNNGGTCIAIAGSNYCVIAADTRMSTGYSILTRDYSKICNLSDKCVMASSGFQADVKALQKNLSARHLIYQHQHNKQMSCPAMAQLLSNTLYYKRFFPYYSFNVLGGLDNEGKGCVFTYDAVGSYERVGYSAQGTGGTLMMPVLDNQLKSPSPLLLPAQDATTPVSESEAVDLAKDVFASAAERDIYTGMKHISSGPWGGEDGNIWDDGVYTGIRQIILFFGDVIESIIIEYDNNGSPFRLKHGESGGNKVEKIQLDYPKEILTSISGHYDKYLRSLTFESNFKKYGPYGVENGTYFSSPLSKGKILGFYGRSGRYLDCIGVHLGEVEEDATTPVSVSGAVDLAKGMKHISHGPWGGEDGNKWDDGVYTGIRQIILFFGDVIESIIIEYDNNGSPFRLKHGESGGNKVEKIQLDYPKEILTSISGHYDKYLRSLTFESNFKKYGPYGVEEGIYFSSSLSKGKILGFYGRSGWYLDCIGVHLGEFHVEQDATSPLSESEAVDLVKDVFASAAERDIYTGDGLEIVVVNAEGVTREFLELRRD